MVEAVCSPVCSYRPCLSLTVSGVAGHVSSGPSRSGVGDRTVCPGGVREGRELLVKSWSTGRCLRGISKRRRATIGDGRWLLWRGMRLLWQLHFQGLQLLILHCMCIAHAAMKGHSTTCEVCCCWSMISGPQWYSCREAGAGDCF